MSSLLPFLCVAIGFSWPGFVSIFQSTIDVALRRIAIPTAATAVCLTGMSLAVMSASPLIATLVVAAALAIAQVIGTRVRPSVSLLISAIGLAGYLHHVI